MECRRQSKPCRRVEKQLDLGGGGDKWRNWRRGRAYRQITEAVRDTASAANTYNFVQLSLEADCWPKSHLEVVARPVVEVDLVSAIESQPERTPEALDSDTRVDCGSGVALGDAP